MLENRVARNDALNCTQLHTEKRWTCSGSTNTISEDGSQFFGGASLNTKLLYWTQMQTSTAMILVLFINVPQLVTDTVYYTVGERIIVWFSRSQASFKQAYCVVDNQVQVALNSVQLICIGPKSVLGEAYATVCCNWLLLRLRNIFSLFISKDNHFYVQCLGTFEYKPVVLAIPSFTDTKPKDRLYTVKAYCFKHNWGLHFSYVGRAILIMAKAVLHTVAF